MPRYPTPSEYQEALQFPATAFLDPELAAGVPVTNALGLPQPITGAFAAVFPFDTAGGRYAVRCFLTRVEDQRAQYRAVARHLEEADLESTVPFDYQREGVRVGADVFPLLKMAWAEGEGLAAFTERHIDDPATLRTLARSWRRLLADLAAGGIAHGDLQHGNVLVRQEDDGVRLVLVDYDTMFVPALAGRTSAEVGHRNYQHPDRTEADFDARLDHFAGLVVYTALRALEEQPDLWGRFSTGENMLFQAGDFYDPDASPLFEALRRLDPVRPLADALARACYLEPAAVPSLEEVLGGARLPERAAPKRRAAPDERRSRSTFERAALPALLGAVAGLAVLGLTAGWGAVLLAALVAVGAGAWGVRRAYGAQSVVRRRRRTEREAAVLEQWIAELEDARRGLDRERRDFLARLDVFRTERLEEVRDDAFERHLRHHFIGELDAVEGVGHKAVVRLKAVGVRNAFHATPERVAEARGLTSETRARIGRWREALRDEVAGEVPGALSPAEEQRLNRQIERRLQQLDAEAARLAAKVDVQRAELDRVRAQQDALPDLTVARYLLYLLRLGPLPSGETATAAPILQRPGEDSIRTREQAQRVRAETAPPSDAAWWEQA
jgi:hypothetical protein